MSKLMRTSVITAGFVLSGALPVKADFTICNKTPVEVTVAAGYVNPKGGFISEGWWKLRPCGGCELVVAEGDTTDRHHYFYRAEAPDGVREGPHRFCTKRGSFKISGNQNCAARGFEEKGFTQVESRSGNHTSNITGSVGGKTCID